MGIEVRDDTLYTSAMPAGSWLIGGQSSSDAAPTAFARESVLNYVSSGLASIASSGSASDLSTGTVPLGRLHAYIRDISNIQAPSTNQVIGFDGSNFVALTVTDAAVGGLIAANNLSDLSNAATAAANLGLTIGTDVQAYDEDLTALAALSGTNTIYYRSAANTWTAVTIGGMLSFAAGTLNVGDAELTALAGLTSAADRLPYFTGSGTADLAAFTSFGRSLVAGADAAAGRTTLELGSLATASTINNDNWSGADLSLANGGTGASLADPNADRVMFWDDSAGAVTWLTVGSGLAITDTTLTVSGAGLGDVVGPASSTDGALALFDLTTGKLLKQSTATGALMAASGVVSAATVDNLILSVIRNGTSTAQIQAALDEGGVQYWPAGSYTMTAPLVIATPIHLFGAGADFARGGSSDATTVRTSSATDTIFAFRCSDFVFSDFNLNRDNAAGAAPGGGSAIIVGDDVTEVTDGAITATDATFTSASSNFTAGDVGKSIYVAGAGAAGVPLLTTIASINSTTSVELTAAASTTVTGATAKWGTIPKNFRISNVTTGFYNDRAIWIKMGASYRLENLNPWGYTSGVTIENKVHPDTGDWFLDGGSFNADTSVGYAIEWLSGGGGYISKPKLLNCAYGLYMNWASGTASGNATFNGGSLENMTLGGIYLTGTGANIFNRFNISGVTYGSARSFVTVDNAATAGFLTDLAITGCTARATVACSIINLGRGVSGASVTGNVLNGSSVALMVGIEIKASAANVRTGVNTFVGCATNVTNGSATGYVGLDNMSNLTLLGNLSGADSWPRPYSLTTFVDNAMGSTQGGIIYRNASAWLQLAPGTAGLPLVTGGAGANPSWSQIAISTAVSGLGTGVATFLGTPSSANLAAAVTDETGTGSLVFGTSPTFTTSIIVPVGSAASPGIVFPSDSNTGIWSPAADVIAVSTGGTERLRIDSTGDFGWKTLGATIAAGVGFCIFDIVQYCQTTGGPGLRYQIVGSDFDLLGINNDNNAYNNISISAGGSQSLIVSSSGANVVGLAQCDSFRIDQAATAIGTGVKTVSNAADSSTNFGKYFSMSLNGTTVYVPCSTIAPT